MGRRRSPSPSSPPPSSRQRRRRSVAVPRRSFDEFARSRGAWCRGRRRRRRRRRRRVGGDPWDSPTGRRRGRRWGIWRLPPGATRRGRASGRTGRGDASSRGTRGGAGGTKRNDKRRGGGGRGVNTGDSFGFGVGADDGGFAEIGSPPGGSNHPGHSRTNPRAGGLHDDTDGAIPLGPGAEGGGGGSRSAAAGTATATGRFTRSFETGSRGRAAGHRRVGRGPARRVPRRVRAAGGADTSPPGEGEFGDDSSSDVGPDDPPTRRRASLSSPRGLTTTRPWRSTSRVGRTRTASG